MKFVVAEPPPRQFVTKWSGTPVWKLPAIAPSVTIDLPLEPVATAQSPKNANRWVPSLQEPLGVPNRALIDYGGQLQRQKIELTDPLETFEATIAK